jgi:pantoate--beta-alanine ligase
VQDLNLDVELELGNTVREHDGLAMSSRNAYLNHQERKLAPFIYQSLVKAKEAFSSGNRDVSFLSEIVKQKINSTPEFRLQYAEIVDLNTLQPLNYITDRALFAVAAFLGTTRLIDNVILGEPETLW